MHTPRSAKRGALPRPRMDKCYISWKPKEERPDFYFFFAVCISERIRRRRELILMKPVASAWL